MCESVFVASERHNLQPTTKMKITISHDQNSIDPSATYSDEQFVDVKKALEAEYEKALNTEFPDSEIEFRDSSDTYSVRVTGIDLDDPSEIEDTASRICAEVFETGNFWV